MGTFNEFDNIFINIVEENLGTVSVKASALEFYKQEELSIKTLEAEDGNDNLIVDDGVKVIIFTAKNKKGETFEVLQIKYNYEEFKILIRKGAHIKIGCDLESLRCMLYEHMHRFHN